MIGETQFVEGSKLTLVSATLNFIDNDAACDHIKADVRFSDGITKFATWDGSGDNFGTQATTSIGTSDTSDGTALLFEISCFDVHDNPVDSTFTTSQVDIVLNVDEGPFMIN